MRRPASRRSERRSGWRSGAARFHALSLVLLLLAVPARSEPIPAGPSVVTLDVAGTAIEAHTYKPDHYAGAGLLVVLHGLGRNAPGYRDYARPLAERYGLLLVAPLFDRQRFPTWRYQAGGIARVRANGEVTPAPDAARMDAVLEAVVEAVRAREGKPDLAFALIGHSAGGQALSRYAAFSDANAQRIVVANPSTYLWPDRDVAFPFGLGGLPESLAGDDRLRHYLARPLVVLLGTADVARDPDLNVSPGAMMQGAHRYERGVAFFRAGQRVARERGWTFGWRLIEVPGVGHSARRMLGSDGAAEALAD